MYKKIVILFILIFPAIVFAQPPGNGSQASAGRKKIIAEIEQKLEDGVVLELLRKANEKIRKSMENNQALSSSQYFAYASSMKTWIKYRWFIADTGLSKKWLKKNYELLAYMSKTQRYMKVAKFNGRTNSAKYKKANEYLKVAHERFLKLNDKVERVATRIRQKAMVKKDIWQRTMRKKYNIKEKAWYE